MRAAICPGVSRLPFTGSTTTVTAFCPAPLASAATPPPIASALRASSSRGLPMPTSVSRAMSPWASRVSDWFLAPVKRLASIAFLIAPPRSLSIACALANSCLSAPTKTTTLPEKAFGKAENSTFIQFPPLLARIGRASFRACGATAQAANCACRAANSGSVRRPPTVSVPALKTDLDDDFSNPASRLGDRSWQARRAACGGAGEPRLQRDRPRRQQDPRRRAQCRQDADRGAAAQRADRRPQGTPVGDNGCQRGGAEERR